MSSTAASLAAARPAEADVLEELGPARSPIEIVTSLAQRRARPRLVYALVATAALFVLLLTQLGLSIATTHGAYQISALQAEQVTMSRQQATYSEKLQVLSSPQNIANNASALGMVRNQNPVYIDVKTGTVYGTPTPAASDAATSSNLVDNSLLKGVGVVTKSKASKDSASSSTSAGAADAKSSSDSVASDSTELAAPQTR